MTAQNYSIDKSTGWITMPDGARFNPYSGEGCENLTLEQLAAYQQERPAGMDQALADRAQDRTGGLELNEHQRLAKEYALLASEVEPMQARMDEIKKIFRNDLDFGTHDISGLKVTVAHNARFDAKKAAEIYPADKYPAFYKTAPDSAAIKRAVAPAVYEALSNEGEPRVTIK